MSAPVIVVGMHKSGTGILARVLHRCGVFMGALRNAHDEAYFFLRRNEQLFRLANATWDEPGPLRAELRQPRFRSQVVERLRSDFHSLRSLSYFGPLRYLRAGAGTSSDRTWGWKDPRSTFTAPIWLEVFPNARILHLTRDGVDVAARLRAREENRPGGPRDPRFSRRCMNLAGGFALWAEYEEMCFEVTRHLPPDRVLRIRYEAFVTRPVEQLQRIARFLRLSFGDRRVSRAVRDVRADLPRAPETGHDEDV